MVTINAFHIRQNSEGKQFIALQLQGDVEMIQSSETGRFYASAKKCTISSTFSEEVAKTLIGKQLPGRIDRVECLPYDYTIETTGQVVSLTHTYVYNPEEKQQMVLEKPVRAAVGV